MAELAKNIKPNAMQSKFKDAAKTEKNYKLKPFLSFSGKKKDK